MPKRRPTKPKQVILDAIEHDPLALPKLSSAPWRVELNRTPDDFSVYVMDRAGAAICTNQTILDTDGDLMEEWAEIPGKADATLRVMRQIRMLPELAALMQQMIEDPSLENRHKAIEMLRTLENPPAEVGEQWVRPGRKPVRIFVG